MTNKLYFASQLPGKAEAIIYPKASLWKRFFASVLDYFIAGVGSALGVGFGLRYLDKEMFAIATGLFLFGLGWHFIYLLSKDSWIKGRSLGKHAFGLMVVHLQTNKPCRIGHSTIRGSLFVLWPLLYAIDVYELVYQPPNINVMLILELLFCLVLLESALIIGLPSGRRIGDKLAGTQVIECRDYRERT